MQVPAIKAAKLSGLRVITADPLATAPGFALADEAYVLDLGNLDQCLSIAQANNINGVMTIAAEYPIPTIAYIAQALGLPGISPETATAVTNKAEMRRKFCMAGVPAPFSLEVTSLDEAMEACCEINAAVVFKPALSHGGRGITKVSSGANNNEIKAAFEHAQTSGRSMHVLVEEYIDGPEFSVEAITFNGETRIIAITDKETSGPPHFVELGHSQPSQLSETDQDLLTSTTLKAIASLGIDWAPSHTEIKLSDQGPRVIEIGARLGGGYITSHLVPLAFGVDLVDAAIALALNRIPHLEPKIYQAAAVRFLVAKPGYVRDVTGLESARCLTGIHEVSIEVDKGDQVIPLRDATGRIGYVVAVGSNVMTAVRRAEEARDAISIQIVREMKDV